MSRTLHNQAVITRKSAHDGVIVGCQWVTGRWPIRSEPMHAFVYRLVERLTNDGPKLSRNRHFATFVSPEGRRVRGGRAASRRPCGLTDPGTS